jgi:hypothetical protein
VAELRSIVIPPNRLGLTEGTWLRWPELHKLLYERGYDALADEIQDQLNGEALEQREVTLSGEGS